MRETDLKQVKSVAKAFVYLDIRETDHSPMIVQHPYTTSGIVMLKPTSTSESKLVNILEDKDAWAEYQSMLTKKVDAAKSVQDITMLIVKTFQLTFLKRIFPFLSPEDLGQYLNDVWMNLEYITSNADVRQSELVKYFKTSDKRSLMSVGDLEIYNSFSEQVEIYRGVTDYNKEHVKSLSWTTDIEKARWFGNRFNHGGYVYRAKIKKTDILAYFSDRRESEIVVDPKGLSELQLFETLNSIKKG